MWKLSTKRISPKRPTTIDGTGADRLFGEPDGARDGVVAGVFRHVDAAQDADGNGDQHRQREHVDRVPQHRHDAAESRVARIVQNEAQRDDPPGRHGEVQDDGPEEQQDEDSRSPQDDGGGTVRPGCCRRMGGAEGWARGPREPLPADVAVAVTRPSSSC